jgi:hypothetical protein
MNVDLETSDDIPTSLGEHAYRNYDRTSFRPNESTYQEFKHIPAFWKDGVPLSRNTIGQRITAERQKFGQALIGKLIFENIQSSIDAEVKTIIFTKKQQASLSESDLIKLCLTRYESLMQYGTADRRVGYRTEEVRAKQKKVTKRGPELDGLILEKCKAHWSNGGLTVSDEKLLEFMSQVIEERPEFQGSEFFSQSAAVRFFSTCQINRHNGQPLIKAKPVCQPRIKAEPMFGGPTIGQQIDAKRKAKEEEVTQSSINIKPKKSKVSPESKKKKVRHNNVLLTMFLYENIFVLLVN